MENKRRRRSKKRGIRAIRGFRKLDPVITILASIVVVLLIAWGGLYWKGSSERSLMAYANGNEQHSVQQPEPDLESEPEPASGSPSNVASGSEANLEWQYESDSSTSSNHDDYAPPTDDSLPAQPAEPTKSAQPNMNKKPQRQSEDSADDELPGSPSVTETPEILESTESPISPISPEEKYSQAMEETQASCEERMKEVEKGAETGIKKVDRNDPYALKAWSDHWTNEINAAESSCDRSFEEVSDKAANESVSTQKIEEWKITYDTKKVELRDESQANLERLLRG